MTRALAGGALVALCLVPAAGPALADEPTWRDTKCARYRADWQAALARRGSDGIGPDFRAANEAFMASGCTTQGHVCPRSPAETDLVNVMTIRLMNYGTASTFLPFGCKPREAPPVGLRPSP